MPAKKSKKKSAPKKRAPKKVTSSSRDKIQVANAEMRAVDVNKKMLANPVKHRTHGDHEGIRKDLVRSMKTESRRFNRVVKSIKKRGK